MEERDRDIHHTMSLFKNRCYSFNINYLQRKLSVIYHQVVLLHFDISLDDYNLIFVVNIIVQYVCMVLFCSCIVISIKIIVY